MNERDLLERALELIDRAAYVLPNGEVRDDFVAFSDEAKAYLDRPMKGDETA